MKFKAKVLIFLINPKTNQVCLSTKAYGIKKGYFNAYGGKIDKKETLEQAAIRELYEESTVKADPKDLKFMGRIFLHVPSIQEDILEYIYLLYKWQGTPSATDEMINPTWFDIDSLPYNQMMPYYEYWIDYVVKKQTAINAFFKLKDFKPTTFFISLDN